MATQATRCIALWQLCEISSTISRFASKPVDDAQSHSAIKAFWLIAESSQRQRRQHTRRHKRQLDRRSQRRALQRKLWICCQTTSVERRVVHFAHLTAQDGRRRRARHCQQMIVEPAKSTTRIGHKCFATDDQRCDLGQAHRVHKVVVVSHSKNGVETNIVSSFKRFQQRLCSHHAVKLAKMCQNGHSAVVRVLTNST